jgi:hypothetical protein
MPEETGGAERGEQAGSGIAQEAVRLEPLRTVLLNDNHRCDDFVCSKSERVTGFFAQERHVLVPQNYCRVFVLPNPADPTHVWGFYTLSPTALVRSRATGSEQKRIPPGLPIPMMLIGFMGKQDGTDKGLGAALILDAARRVHRNPDIPAWGLTLDSEGGPENEKLWKWYQEQGFTPAKPDDKGRSGVMYASLRKFAL